MPDPDLSAILLALAAAGVFALAALPGAVRRRRSLQQACASCGRRILHGEKTCDCAD